GWQSFRSEWSVIYFFFQAVDGIRGFHVTGVQTCALPISLEDLTKDVGESWLPAWSPDGTRVAFSSTRDGNPEIYIANRDGSNIRSEERRVGKECRTRRAA